MRGILVAGIFKIKDMGIVVSKKHVVIVITIHIGENRGT